MQLKSRDGDAMPEWKMFVVRRWKSEQTFHKLLIMRARVSKREGKWSSRRDREMLQSSWADAAAAAALGAGAGCDPPLTFPTQRWHFKWSVFWAGNHLAVAFGRQSYRWKAMQLIDATYNCFLSYAAVAPITLLSHGIYILKKVGQESAACHNWRAVWRNAMRLA